MSVTDKKDKAGPRKLLAMDGGGIRGVMTLEVLEKIESELQKWAKVVKASGAKVD